MLHTRPNVVILLDRAQREPLGEPGVDVPGSSGHAAHSVAHLAPLFIPYTAHSRVRTMIYSLCHQIFVTFNFLYQL
jgi:hypothetical protein